MVKDLRIPQKLVQWTSPKRAAEYLMIGSCSPNEASFWEYDLERFKELVF